MPMTSPATTTKPIKIEDVYKRQMTALVSFERVFEVLDLKPLVRDKPNAIDIQQGPSSITFEHVDFR